MRNEPLRLADGETVPVPCIADAEIVLEGEILPEGWVHTEGPFSEFNRLMGGMHMNPRVRIKSIMHRKDAMYYALQMPWENIWMSAPIYEAAARRVLFEAGVQTDGDQRHPRRLLPLAYRRVDQESARRRQERDHGAAYPSPTSSM